MPSEIANKSPTEGGDLPGHEINPKNLLQGPMANYAALLTSDQPDKSLNLHKILGITQNQFQTLVSQILSDHALAEKSNNGGLAGHKNNLKNFFLDTNMYVALLEKDELNLSLISNKTPDNHQNQLQTPASQLFSNPALAMGSNIGGSGKEADTKFSTNSQSPTLDAHSSVPQSWEQFLSEHYHDFESAPWPKTGQDPQHIQLNELIPGTLQESQGHFEDPKENFHSKVVQSVLPHAVEVMDTSSDHTGKENLEALPESISDLDKLKADQSQKMDNVKSDPVTEENPNKESQSRLSVKSSNLPLYRKGVSKPGKKRRKSRKLSAIV
ncbi:hypothetical protein CROQUDRAFT_725967 [Cronartium quercuum f. sp. fusiforme G11]|uniref:Uncharacterized protein n=1 Tax=Cronartium quercuum f. sp. fusiforme G11 TaxID=708437 RepID=A0A9P6N6T5_9BASI|nr:hypothetical protein CROQUDRAFT_725967 [Cronartium quercuum f. sp. fusiforme G11]